MISNIVLSVIGLIAIVAGIWLVIMTKKVVPAILSVVGLIAVIVSASYSYVPSGYVGIMSWYGQIQEETAHQGLNWNIPFIEKVNLVNCKQQEKTYKGQIWSETSERTELYCENIAVDYQINPEYASWIWINVEEWDTNLVKATSVESGIKAATKQYNDIDVTDRSKIEKTAKECIQSSINTKYGAQIVDIVSVTIGNINFSEAYNEAIEKKAQAKLAAETAQFENQQAINQKESEAKQKKIWAEAQAEAITIQAEAEAEANRKIAESLTPELVEKMKIDKWDGSLPAVTTSGGTGSLYMDVGDLVGSDAEVK